MFFDERLQVGERGVQIFPVFNIKAMVSALAALDHVIFGPDLGGPVIVGCVKPAAAANPVNSVFMFTSKVIRWIRGACWRCRRVVLLIDNYMHIIFSFKF